MKALNFNSFQGIINTVQPERVGSTGFVSAKNVYVDNAGQVVRRLGYDRVASGSWHSLYECESGRYVTNAPGKCR